MNLNAIENIVSIYQITKIMYKVKSDFEKEIEYQKWLNNKEEIENKIMDDINKSIEKKLIDLYKENTERMKAVLLQMEKNQDQHRLNFIDFPLNVYLWNNGTLFFYADTDEGDCDEQIVYTLHIATDSNTAGSLSVQYVGSDGSFLSHKQIVKVIKMKNSMGKYA